MGDCTGGYFNLNEVMPSDVKWFDRLFNGFLLRMGVGIRIGMLHSDK